MHNLAITHDFVRKLTKNIRAAYGRDIPNTKVLELIADALGCQAGPMMHALKNAKATDIGSGSATRPDEYFECLTPTTGGEISYLEDLQTVDLPDLIGLKEVGKAETGLVVIAGETGAGKTVTANALVRHWVHQHGRNASVVGDDSEHPGLQRMYGQGQIRETILPRRLSFRDSMAWIRAEDPAVVMFANHLHSIEDLAYAMKLSREKLVVISCYGDSPSSILWLLNARPVADHLTQFNNSISVFISLTRRRDENRGVRFKASVGFGDRCF